MKLSGRNGAKLMELFDYLKALTESKEELDFDNDEVRKGYSPYMINKFVSMVEIFIPLVNEINMYEVPKETHFQYFATTLPKRKQYFKYLKKSKDLSEDDKLLLANHFQIGKKDAEKYIQMLDEKELQEIIDIYAYGKNGKAK